jgi:hypothetical protein
VTILLVAAVVPWLYGWPTFVAATITVVAAVEMVVGLADAVLGA